MLNTLCMLIIEFFIFSCLGWIVEVILKLIQYKKFINRGFLIGPYCPIYGFGAVLLTVVVGGIFVRHGTIWETFLAGFIVCGVLEYFTSWYMEKMFHARWWDYSQKPMNLNGRIWIGNLILFGISSVIIVLFIDPVLFGFMEKIPDTVIYINGIVITLIFSADYFVSHLLMNIVKKDIDSRSGDSTEEISLYIRNLLKDKNMLFRRIQSSYPKLRARPKKFIHELNKTRKEYKESVKNTKRLLKEKAKFKANGLVSDERKLTQKLEAAVERQKRLHEKFKDIKKKYL